MVTLERLLTGTFGRFLLTGGLCAVLNLAFLWTLTERVGAHYLLSALLSFIFINGIGFGLNKYYAFARQGGSLFNELGKYYTTMLGSATANLLLMALFVELVGIHYLFASIVVTCLLTIANFLIHQGWTFNMSNPRAK